MTEVPTAPGAPEVEDTDLPDLTPDDVPIERLDGDETDEIPDGEFRTQVWELMTPPSRAAIVDALLQAGHEALTVSEMVDRHDGVTTSSFNRHKDALTDRFGVMVEAGKRGNAQTYRLNTNHPAVQLLGMINQVYTHGTTPPLLGSDFYRTED